MKIENGLLIVKIGVNDATFVLPAVPADAKVKAWSVPVDYRADGLFVAVNLPGQAEEVPACNLAATEYLGELALGAGDAEKLEAAKIVRLEEISAACNAAITSLAETYPEREVQSWPQQVKEAEALAISPQASAPLLSAIADARGLPVSELASRVLTKMVAYAAMSGELIGRRQANEYLISLASTHEDLAEIVW